MKTLAKTGPAKTELTEAAEVATTVPGYWQEACAHLIKKTG